MPLRPPSEIAIVPYRAIVESANEGVWVIDTDRRTTYVNAKLADMLGYAAEDLVGTDITDHLDEPHRTLARSARTHRGRERSGSLKLRLVRADGSTFSAHVSASPLHDDAGVYCGHVGLFTDLTARNDAQQRLQESQRALAEAQAIAHIGSWAWNVAADEVAWSDEMCRIYGLAPGAFRADFGAFIDRVHPQDRDEVARVIGDAFERRAGFSLEHRIVREDGEVRLLHARGEAVCDASGQVIRIVGTGQDITERRESEQRLQYLADHDPLTGLMNRRRFVEEVDRHVAFAARYESPGAVILLDLDHFKLVNDSLGHAVGDEVISSVAHKLGRRLRRSDTLARLGGDEFAVLLPAAARAEALSVAESLRAALAEPGVRGATALTASVGVTHFQTPNRLTSDDLLVEADVAMYEAKEAGRDRVVLFERGRGHTHGVRRRLTWSDRIRQALEDDRFRVHAQPIVSLKTGEIAKYELLLRMRAGDGMLFKPATFLPVAERFGLIRAVDRWMVAAAARLLADPRLGAPVAVNLSGDSLSDHGLPAYVEQTLAALGADGSRLTFEVTETAAIANLEQARALIAHVTQLGCRFALDDFGAGFGSFYYLKHLPFHYLKIDGEFIRALPDDATDQLLVRALVDTARGLGSQTVAEFVGSQATVERLRELGVDYAQGYYLGRPQPVEDALAGAGH